MPKRIGDFFVERGLITDEQRHQILNYSGKAGLRFGEAGVQLGFLTKEKLIELFGPNYSVDLFQLDPKFFPDSTRDLLPVETLIRWGALLLGFKTEQKLFRGTQRFLNIGLLNPGDPHAIQAIQKAAEAGTNDAGGEPIQGVKIFLILADQYLDVIREVYRLSDEELRRRSPSEIDRTLAVFLETAPQ